MKKYRTALGKNVDMAGLVAQNEKVRAVGNMKVNARGDTIDSEGKIIVPVTQKINENYAKTVNNRAAQVTRNARPQPKAPVRQPTKHTISKSELTAEEQLLESSFDDDLEVEQIKQQSK